ncbi:RNA ligase family protein [Rhizobium sp. G187]|uniref:RNA ligase family protein n=1 Tax=Rhizobium sp. G187 TaxID=3451352 RepID=UPI003EE53CCC
MTEKVDGSCVAVARVGDEIHALNRAGYLALSSPYALHHAFHRWVKLREKLFLDMLLDGERIVGEWLHTATGTRYDIVDPDKLFISFSIMRVHDRIPYDNFSKRVDEIGLPRAHVLQDGGPLTIEAMLDLLGESGFHGALDGTEGAVWLHENANQFSAIAKYVKHTKIDGRYLSGNTGAGDILNYSGAAF